MNDTRSIMAIVLCVLFYLGYTNWLNTKYPDRNKPAEAETQSQAPSSPNATGLASATGGTPSAEPGAAPVAGDVKKLTPEELTVENDKSIYRLSQDVGGFESITLKDYMSDKTKEAHPINLLDGAMALQGTTDVVKPVAQSGGFAAEREGRTIRFSRQLGAVKVVQEYKIPEKGYGLSLQIRFTNTGTTPIDLAGGLLLQEAIHSQPKRQGIASFLPGVVSERNMLAYRADDSTKHEDLKSFCKDGADPIQVENKPISFFGVDRHYFLAVVEPKAKSLTLSIRRQHADETSCTLTMVGYDKLGMLGAGETTSVDYEGYFGPKDARVMADYGGDVETSIDTGFFHIFSKPLLAIIEGFYSLIGNYGLSIILLTIMLKVVFYPLMRAQSISARKMKVLAPQMAAIKEKLKGDPQKMQQETMKLYAANKINPMAGCLPILPQIPVFFSFYQVLQTSIQLRHAPFFGWIQDLSAHDPYYVTPLLLGGAMVAQQRLTPPAGMDKTQEKIMMFMPIMFTAMMLSLPAGLTLYMLTNTCFGIAQQQWLFRRLDKQETVS